MEIATFIGPVYAQARYVAAIAAMAVSFGASAATPFTFNPPAAGLDGASFTASSLIVSDYATVTHSFSSGANPQLSGFSEDGFLSVVAARLGSSTAGQTADLNSKYGLYIDFHAEGTVTSVESDGFYRGTITQLTYTLFGYNGTATFSPTGNTVPSNRIELGSGSLIAGTGSFNGQLNGGLVTYANANANLTFAPNADAVQFFPFKGIVQTSFSNNSAQISNTLNGFEVAEGGGSINFLSVTPVPEPETYAMLIAGLGLVGFVASRRGRKQAS